MTIQTTNTAQLLNGNTGLNTVQGTGGKMPYKVFKEGGGFKVYKLDEAGNKVGKAMSDKPMTHEAATAQMKALYASEKKATKKELDLEGEEVVTKNYGGSDSWQPEPIPVEVVGMDMGGGPTTFADLIAQANAAELAEVMNGLTEQFGQLSCNIMCAPGITDKAAALKALAAEFQTMLDTYTSETPSPAEQIEEAAEMADKELEIIQQIVGDNQPDKDKAKIGAADMNNKPDSDFLYIEPGGKKDDGGKTVPRKLRHLYVGDVTHVRNALSRLGQPDTGTTGGEKWLTPELRKTLTAKAQKMLKDMENKKELYIWKEGNTYKWLAAYSNNRRDDEAEIIASESHKEFDEALTKKEWPMPEVYLWHIPYPVGRTDYHAYDESAGFPVAAGHFYSGMEWAAEGILKENWDGVSHGMPDSWVKYDPNNDKVIIRHRTKEITFLPLWAAANKLAFSVIKKESTMTDELEKGLPAHKRPEFVKAFGEERTAEIEAALADKSKEADDAGIAKKEVETVSKAEMAEVLKELKAMFTALDNRLGAIEKSQVKEADTFDLMAILKSKSVIGKEVAKIDGRSALAKDTPEETINTAGTMHPVGLVNNLIAANQNYKGGLR